MQITQHIIGQANCPTNCPSVKQGNDITAKVKLKDDYQRRDGTYAIYIQCFVKQQQVRIPVGISVTKKEFDKAKGRVRKSSPYAGDYNLMIEALLQRIHEMRVQVRLGKMRLEVSTFKDFITNASITTDFTAYMHWKIGQRNSYIEANSQRHARSVLNIFRKFRPSLPFNEITNQVFFDFTRYLEKVRKNKHNTVGHKLKVLKTYLNLARKDGFNLEMPSEALRGREQVSRTDALTSDQLEKLQALYDEGYLKENLQQTARCFLFSCYTGLRYGDVAALSKSNFTGKHLVVAPHKTRKNGKLLKLALNRRAAALVQQHDEKPLGPVISNQKMNKNLKEINAFLRLPFKLTFHVSRHTFATVMLERGGSIEVTSKLMGHSKISQTEVYSHIADARLEAQMRLFDP